MLTPKDRGQILGGDDESESKIKENISVASSEKITIIDNSTAESINTSIPVPTHIKKEVIDQTINDYAVKRFDEMFGNRFVSEKDLTIEEKPTPIIQKYEVIMKRTKTIWTPCPLLCEKMNIAEPMTTKANSKKSSSFSLFSHLGKSKKNHRRVHNEREFVPSAKPEEDDETVLAKMKQTISSTSLTVNKSITVPADTVRLAVEPSGSKTEAVSATIKVNVVPKKPTPKTDLEIKIFETEKQHPSEKKNIYKAIFDSSSEDEDEQKDDEKNDNSSLSLPNNATASITFNLKTSAKTLNILRNTSPPRGIFANFLKPPTIVSQPEPDIKAKDSADSLADSLSETAPDLYGPILPKNIVRSNLVGPTANNVTIINSIISNDINEWVDKSQVKNKEKKRHKKEKKSKKSHEKSKKSKSKKKKRDK